jgi:Toprim domain
MVARVKHEPAALAVIFEREGEIIERAQARDGRQAVLRAASIIIGLGELRAGDKLFVVDGAVLRFHSRCPFGGELRPSLLALYRSIIGDEPRAIMRTALTTDARKIDRKALGNVGGAAIKLSDDANVTMALVIGEGLETTLAGMMLGFAPAWAIGSASGIGKFPVLPGIEALTILGEPDGANDRAISECFARWSAAGREMYRATSMTGGDLNDATMKGHAA